MNLSTTKVQVQKATFSLSLEKSIALLILPHRELAANIEQELQDNPLLEVEFEAPPIEKTLENLEFMSRSPSGISDQGAEEDRDFESSSIANMMTLEDHFFQQLFWEISDPVKREYR